MARLTYVPLHSIIVTRPDPKATDKNKLPDVQVDALEEYKRTGKAFKFTQDEIDQIAETNGGSTTMALRDPTDEVEDMDTVVQPGASNAQPQTAGAGGTADPSTTKASDDKAGSKDSDL